MRARARRSPREDLLELLIDTLATYRLVKLIRHDKLTEPIRDKVLATHGPPDRSKISYLINCPWCLSVYFGGAIAVGRQVWPGSTAVASRGLALSALTGLATPYLDR